MKNFNEWKLYRSHAVMYYLKHETQSNVLYPDKARTASVLNSLKNERYYLFICEVIFKPRKSKLKFM